MRTAVVILVFAALMAMPRVARAQALVFKYFFNEVVEIDSGASHWTRFNPVAPASGIPQRCLSWTPQLLGLPDRVLYAPRWEERRDEIYLWFAETDSLSHAQIIRHELPLPIRDPADSGKLVIEPLTPLTSHTVFLIDLGDSTIIAYNHRAGVPQRAVEARLDAVRDVKVVQDVLRQLSESAALCRRTKPRGPP